MSTVLDGVAKAGKFLLINSKGLKANLKSKVKDDQLEKLPGAKLSDVQWNPGHACLPETREQLLAEILNWIHTGAQTIFWLSGAAGTGKSSVANSIAQYLDSLGRLGASFQFHRDFTTTDTPRHLFGNLCYQLAFYNVQVKNAVLSALDQYGSFDAMSLLMQVRRLLVEPLNQCLLTGPVVIVIDALDESGPDLWDSQKASRDTLVNAIVTEFPSLSSSIKVLITSREEGSLTKFMPTCCSLLHKEIANTENTKKDIFFYIQYRIDHIRKHKDLEKDWPTSVEVMKLAEYADELFIWANVACSYIEHGDDPEIQLDELLNRSIEGVAAEERLDHLFEDVLNRGRQNKRGIQLNNWSFVLETIAALKTPLTSKAMDSLLGLGNKQTITLLDGRDIRLNTSKHIITALAPILKTSTTGVVQLLHKSVFDFLTERAKQPFKVDLNSHNAILALQCLNVMNQHLKYDICHIQTFTLLNSEVEDLQGKIDRHLPKALQYACCYFAHHLIDGASQDPQVHAGLQRFLTCNLLFWIEVMSLLKKMYEAEECLKNIFTWLNVCIRYNYIYLID
jgi:hypothetical protein